MPIGQLIDKSLEIGPTGALIEWALNVSGAQVIGGSPVVHAVTGTGSETRKAFTTATQTFHPRPFGVLLATTDANEYGPVVVRGFVESIRVNGTLAIAVGDLLGTFTTAGIASRVPKGEGSGFIRALDTYSVADSAGFVDGIVLGPSGSAAPSGGIVNVRAYGAVGDGVTDDTTAIQAAADALRAKDTLYFPATGNNFYLCTAAISLPKVNGLVVAGDGRLSSEVRFSGAGIDGFKGASYTFASGTNGQTFRDIYISGASAPRYGINMTGMHRSTLQNVRVEGFTATNGAGVAAIGCIIVSLIRCELSSNYDGLRIASVSGGGTNINCNGCIIESNTNYGINAAAIGNGVAISGCVIESNAKGGIYASQDANGWAITGCYFEENRDGSSASFDIYIADASYCKGWLISGNYFNGAVDPTDTAVYFPIRMDFADGVDIRANILNRGKNFILFGASANSAGIRVVDTAFGTQVGTDAATMATLFDFNTNYKPFPQYGYVAHQSPNVSGIDADFDQTNLQTTAIGSWTYTAGAGSSFGAGTNVIRNATAHDFARGSAVTNIAVTITVSATSNEHLRGRWVTFEVPLYGASGSPSVDIAIEDGATTTTRSVSPGTSDTLFARVSHFIPAAQNGAVTLRVTMTVNTTTVSITAPRLWLGLGSPASEVR